MTDIVEIRKFAKEWCEYATNGNSGRAINDPIYLKIVENRVSPTYSSCGDLIHWMLYKLGCRESFINRNEFNGWVNGININKLVARPVGSNPHAELWNNTKSFDSLLLGDILVFWNSADPNNTHTCVVEKVENGILYSWDYGQGSPVGGKKNSRIIKDLKRPIQSVLRLDNIVFSVPSEIPPGYKQLNNTPIIIGVGILTLVLLYFLKNSK